MKASSCNSSGEGETFVLASELVGMLGFQPWVQQMSQVIAAPVRLLAA